MKYLSVCSGIEAASMAWHPMGWEPVAFSEIEPFPSKVLAHHYPQVPNLGDMTKFKEWPDYANVNVLVGGTPCQSFSIAGLRKGLADPRGNLMLTYLAIAAKYRPTWLVWENVPGVLSSNGGKDFGTFLAGLGECGYGFAYRVLDAQFVRTDGYPYAVPQRRRRVFVVGHLGDWRRAAAVLFDSESLRGNPPPSREAGKTASSSIAFGVAERSEVGHCLRSGASKADKHESTTYIASITQPVAPTLNSAFGSKLGLDNQHIDSGAGLFTYALAGNTIGRKPENGGNGTGYDETGSSYTLTKTDVHAVAYRTNAAGQVNAQDGIAAALNTQTDPCAQILLQQTRANAAHAFKVRGGCAGGGKGYLGSDETAFTLSTTHDQDIFTPQMQVRRLTPAECARLQGFPDDYLPQVPGYSDSAAYKALGNSMAVNVMQLIGQRIQMVSEIKQAQEIAA